MAIRRMFSKTIIDSDEFLEMPVSARLLYFDLGMRADDDGFVSPKRIMKFTNATDDDLKVLLAKKYVLNFENKVLVIRDWKVNNFIRPDRYTPTIYQEYLKRLELSNSNQYQLASGIPPVIPLGDPELGKSKVRLELGKDTNIDTPLLPLKELTPLEEANIFFSGIPTDDFITNLSLKADIPKEDVFGEVSKFISYWTEPTKSGKKQKWELERTFDVRRRLMTWFSNKKEWQKGQVNKNKVSFTF